MSKLNNLIEKKEVIEKKLLSARKTVSSLEKQLAEIEDQINETQGEYQDNIIKDLLNIHAYEWVEDKSKKKVAKSYILEKLIENGSVDDDAKLTTYNQNSDFEMLIYDPKMGDVFKGIAFYVTEHKENIFIFLMLVASEPVDENTKDKLRTFSVFDNIKFKSDEYSLINNEYVRDRILVMTRYSSKYEYDDNRIIRDFDILFEYALYQTKLNTEQSITELDYFCKVLPYTEDFLCNHNKKEMQIKIPFLGPNGKIFYGGPYEADYCAKCDTYYVNDRVFQIIRCSGAWKALIAGDNNTSGSSGDLLAESVLHICGYNVAKKENYTDDQRQKILGIIIDKGLLDKDRIISYINFYIKLNRSISNKRDAVSKWSKDLLFVKEYGE